MASRSSGRWQTVQSPGGEPLRAFLPDPLPPTPPLAIDHGLRDALDAAQLWLGRLDGVSSLLPATDLLLPALARRDAVLSCQIDGAGCSLTDVFLFEADEAPGARLDDVVQVSSHVAALEHGLRRVGDGLPVGSRLIREVHGILQAHGRADGAPGEFRRTQTWLGGTRPDLAVYVPPPPGAVPELMARLDEWLGGHRGPAPAVIRAALAHAQLEAIHPFVEGNGRVGRLLVSLVLRADRILARPLLHVGQYLKQNRSRYFARLARVRDDGDWEAWLSFFADAVRWSAEHSVDLSRRLSALLHADDARIVAEAGRVATTARRIYRSLLALPVQSAPRLVRGTSLSMPAVNKGLAALESLGIVRETTGRRRNRIFSYAAYLALLAEGTEVVR